MLHMNLVQYRLDQKGSVSIILSDAGSQLPTGPCTDRPLFMNLIHLVKNTKILCYSLNSNLFNFLNCKCRTL